VPKQTKTEFYSALQPKNAGGLPNYIIRKDRKGGVRLRLAADWVPVNARDQTSIPLSPNEIETALATSALSELKFKGYTSQIEQFTFAVEHAALADWAGANVTAEDALDYLPYTSFVAVVSHNHRVTDTETMTYSTAERWTLDPERVGMACEPSLVTFNADVAARRKYRDWCEDIDKGSHATFAVPSRPKNMREVKAATHELLLLNIQEGIDKAEALANAAPGDLTHGDFARAFQAKIRAGGKR
jgi:hypothetical protein